MKYPLTAVIVPAEEGGFIGYVAELPGANTQGETLAETLENLKEAVGLVLEVQRTLNFHSEQNATTIPLTLVWD